ncbi:MAG: putative low-complexity protein, partial [Zhongshania sp.]
MKNTAMTALGAAMLASSMASVAVADTNPFAAKVMSSGYQLADYAKDAEGKCGEAKCGAEKKAAEAKCGADKAAKEGKCGEAKCGADKAAAEAKCGA